MTTTRGYGWFFAAFAALLVSGALIGVAAASFLASLTPLYGSIVCSVAAIALAVVAWWRSAPRAER